MENVIVAKFKVESETYQAFSKLKKAQNEDCMVSQLMIVKRNGTEFEAMDSYDSGINTKDDSVIGGLVGALAGLIGGPLGVLFYGSVGVMIGATFDIGDQIVEYASIEHISKALEDGETALICLAQEVNPNYIDLCLKEFAVDVTRFDASEVLEEIEELEEQRKIEEKEAKKAKREEQRAVRKEKIEQKKNSIKDYFAKLKK